MVRKERIQHVNCKRKRTFQKFNREQDILEFNQSSATVDQAANALNVIPAKIAKTLSFKDKEGNAFLVVTAGDSKIDNKNLKNNLEQSQKC